MSDLKKMTMSELIAKHNELNPSAPVTEFKNLAAARAAVAALENPSEASTETAVPATGDTQKYNSSGKRGPTQGVGSFAKEQIALGKTNAEVLEAVKTQFPTAKTTTSCIAYYRTAMKKGPPPCCSVRDSVLQMNQPRKAWPNWCGVAARWW